MTWTRARRKAGVQSCAPRTADNSPIGDLQVVQLLSTTASGMSFERALPGRHRRRGLYRRCQGWIGGRAERAGHCVLASMHLQHGVTPSEIQHSISGPIADRAHLGVDMTDTADKPRPAFVLHLRAEPWVSEKEAIRALRRVLKSLRRQCALQCLEVSEVKRKPEITMPKRKPVKQILARAEKAGRARARTKEAGAAASPSSSRRCRPTRPPQPARKLPRRGRAERHRRPAGQVHGKEGKFTFADDGEAIAESEDFVVLVRPDAGVVGQVQRRRRAADAHWRAAVPGLRPAAARRARRQRRSATGRSACRASRKIRGSTSRCWCCAGPQRSSCSHSRP